MAKTITVIELLNEASKGNNITFRDGGGTYKDSLWTFINMYTDKKQSFDEIKELLNSEVIVIEEQQDLDIQALAMFEQEYFIENECNMSLVDVDLAIKINELVQAVKQQEREINKLKEK